MDGNLTGCLETVKVAVDLVVLENSVQNIYSHCKRFVPNLS